MEERGFLAHFRGVHLCRKPLAIVIVCVRNNTLNLFEGSWHVELQWWPNSVGVSLLWAPLLEIAQLRNKKGGATEDSLRN